MLELFGHPFSSYTWKALIALYESNTPFTFRMIDASHPQHAQRIQALSPLGKFPVLIDGDRVLCESSIIIEYLQHRYPADNRLLPVNPDASLEVRTFDRFMDNYVMSPAQLIVNDFMRKPADRDPVTRTTAGSTLRKSYTWLNANLPPGVFACGDAFTLGDCAAAPALFYADWVEEISPQLSVLRDYRARLLARPSVRRCVDEARPFRSLFPPGAPDRD